MPMGRVSTPGILGALPGHVRHVLELHSPDGAFAAVKDHLRAAGFFGGGAKDVVADLYLGYGLSRARRRGPTRCSGAVSAARSSRACCGSSSSRLVRTAEFRIGEWEPDVECGRNTDGVEAVKAGIERGDVYQVNLVQHLSAPFDGEPHALAAALAPLRPLAPAAADRRRVDDRVRLARALPRPAGDASGRGRSRARGRSARPRSSGVREGRGRARDDRRPRAERPLAGLRGPARCAGPSSWPSASSPGSRISRARVEGRLRARATGPAELLRRPSRAGPSPARRRSRRSTTSPRSSPSAGAPRWAPSAGCGRTATSSSRSPSAPSRLPRGGIHLWVGGGIVWDSDPVEGDRGIPRESSAAARGRRCARSKSRLR